MAAVDNSAETNRDSVSTLSDKAGEDPVPIPLDGEDISAAAGVIHPPIPIPAL